MSAAGLRQQRLQVFLLQVAQGGLLSSLMMAAARSRNSSTFSFTVSLAIRRQAKDVAHLADAPYESPTILS